MIKPVKGLSNEAEMRRLTEMIKQGRLKRERLEKYLRDKEEDSKGN